VAAFDETPGLSADEVAKKTSTDVETVRNCMKARRWPGSPSVSCSALLDSAPR